MTPGSKSDRAAMSWLVDHIQDKHKSMPPMKPILLQSLDSSPSASSPTRSPALHRSRTGGSTTWRGGGLIAGILLCLAPGNVGGDTAERESELDAGRTLGFCGTGRSGFDHLLESTAGRPGIGLHTGHLPPADTLTEPTVVDVLFLYTPQTVIGQGDEAGIHERVRTAIEETNYRLTNSLINVQINPVFIGLIDYPETGDMGLDLTRLANGNEGLEGAHALRNLYQADLVCLITELEREGVGGWARDATPHGGNPSTGFAVVRRKGLRPGSNLLAHELGHLLGCHHDREHAGDLNSDFIKARKAYIFGHRFKVEGVTYMDVMSYLPGINVPYFSNPRLNLDGVPMGFRRANPCRRTARAQSMKSRPMSPSIARR